MKKFVLCFVVSVFIACSSFAQTIDLGVKAGLNTSWFSTAATGLDLSELSFSDFSTDKTKSGYSFGLFARVGKKLYLQPELLYSKKSGITNFQSGEVSAEQIQYNQDISVTSLDIPLLLGYKVLDLKLLSVHAFAGPAASIVLDKESSLLDIDSNTIVDAGNNYNSLIWDLQFGAGIDIAKFTFDVRYSMGITNISDASYDSIIDEFNFENKANYLTFSLGFKLF